jgi:DNA-binding response OmpR family regulator
MRILIVEDNPKVAKLLKIACEKFPASCDMSTSGKIAISLCKITNYDAVILDLGLPDLDGLEVLKTLRKREYHLPVLILTARGNIQDRITGLDLGADDYLVKPFSIEELLARLRTLLRRPGTLAGSILIHGNIKLDLCSKHLDVKGKSLFLGKTEIAVLSYLIRNAGITVPKDAMKDRLYGFDDDVSENAIQVAIHRLRKKLVSAGATFELKTLRGIGYILRVEKVTA